MYKLKYICIYIEYIEDIKTKTKKIFYLDTSKPCHGDFTTEQQCEWCTMRMSAAAAAAAIGRRCESNSGCYSCVWVLLCAWHTNSVVGFDGEIQKQDEQTDFVAENRVIVCILAWARGTVVVGFVCHVCGYRLCALQLMQEQRNRWMDVRHARWVKIKRALFITQKWVRHSFVRCGVHRNWSNCLVGRISECRNFVRMKILFA